MGVATTGRWPQAGASPGPQLATQEARPRGIQRCRGQAAGWTRYLLTGRHPRDGLSEGRPAADERPAMAHLTLRSPWLLAAAAITPLAAGLVALPSTSVAATTAAGAPGTSSHFDLARKDCLGTARNSSSKVWFTVAGGV